LTIAFPAWLPGIPAAGSTKTGRSIYSKKNPHHESH
jgi:hypothetical protein